jgi:F-type H+-transporting ATPase subunit b
MRKLSILLALTAASPAMAASKNPFSAYFWSFGNTDLIVAIAFFVFIGVLFYFKVPAMIGGMLDNRADTIKSELDEARKQKEVQEQANRIIEAAKDEAAEAAVQAKADIKTSIARRLAAAEERIASAEASAVKEVRDSAIVVAVAAARDVVAKQMTAASGNQLIDDAISQVEAKLH